MPRRGAQLTKIHGTEDAMQDSDNDGQFNKGNLDSPAYRQRLMRKINCLIAVLEVACSKVRRSLDAPNADVTRLERIQSNLTQTLDVCRRAKGALERREQLPADLPGQLSQITDIESLDASTTNAVAPARRGRQVEFASEDEARRFDRLAPIDAKEVADVDFDELSRRFFEG